MNAKDGLKMEKALYKLIKSSMAQTGLKVKRTPSSPTVLIPSHTEQGNHMHTSPVILASGIVPRTSEKQFLNTLW